MIHMRPCNDRPRITAINTRACTRCGADVGQRCIPTNKPTHRIRLHTNEASK
mgnify:CR=1 FL=1